MDHSSVDAWNNLNKEKQVEFMKSVRDLTPSNLRVRLRQYVEDEIECRESISLRGTGRFLDSPDLADKYTNKPNLLKAIRANARTIPCPEDGRTMYEDMQYDCKETLRRKREMDDLAEVPIRLLTKRKKHEKQQTQVDNWLEFLKASQEELETRSGH